jgi:hypothetical protein
VVGAPFGPLLTAQLAYKQSASCAEDPWSTPAVRIRFVPSQ